MEPLFIEATENTPRVQLDQKSGKFEFTGNSLTENPGDFYRPVLKWVNQYAAAPNGQTEIQFKFNYLNIESTKLILDILTALQTIQTAKVIWFFDEENEDMEEIGEELAELVKIPFEFKFQ